MSEPARIALRLLGFLMLLVGLASVVVLFYPGPGDVAEWMGQNCARGRNSTGETCTVGDVILIALGSPVFILLGFVLTITLRPPDKGPITLDFSKLGRS